MASKRELLRDINRMIEELSTPLSSEELRNGWTEESRLNYMGYFSDLKTAVQRGDLALKSSLIRGMDSWGIVNGPLLELAASVSLALNDLKKPQKKAFPARV